MAQSFPVDAQAACAAGKDTLAKGIAQAQAHQRERGLWSFLTWSFFLSQLAAGNAFAGAAAQGSGGAELQPLGGVAGSGPNGSSSLGRPDPQALGTEDGPGAEAAASAAMQAHAALAHNGNNSSGADQIVFVADAGNEMTVATAQGVAAVVGGSADPDPGPGVTPDTPPDVVPPLDGGLPPGVELPPIVDLPPILDGVLPPVLETVDNLIEGLGPTLDGLLDPVVATVDDLAGILSPTLEHLLSPVADIADGLAQTLEPIVDPLLAPVGGLVDDVGGLLAPVTELAGDILSLADPVVDILQPVLSPVSDLVDAAQPILDPVVDVASPVVDLLSPVTEPLLAAAAPIMEPVSDILPLGIGNGGLLSGLLGGAGGTGDALGSGGAIQFSPEANDAGHDLFQGGSYTEYGLAMHDEPSDVAGSNAGDPISNIVLTVGALLGDDDTSGNGLPITLTDGLHSGLGLRGLGDGWL